MKLIRWMAFAGGITLSSVVLGGTAAYAVEPCTLITPAQAAAAMGVPEASTGQGTQRCQWVPKKSAQGPSKSVILSLEDAKGFAAAHQPLGREITPVSGIGDEAVQTTTQGLRTVLTVKKGQVYFAIRVSGKPTLYPYVTPLRDLYQSHSSSRRKPAALPRRN